MKTRAAFLALCAIALGGPAAAAEPCDWVSLLAQRNRLPALDAEPELPSGPNAQLRRFVLADAGLASDGYRYDGVVDLAAGRAWVMQYGGIAGHVDWFGPLRIDPARYAGCPTSFRGLTLRPPAEVSQPPARAPDK